MDHGTPCCRAGGRQAGGRDRDPARLPRNRSLHLESGGLFVAAAASCLAVTFAGLADQAGLVYAGLKVDGDGVVGLRADGRFGFTRLLLRLEVEVDPVDGERARELAEKAEESCLVAVSLDLPVETTIVVQPAGPVRAPALSPAS